VSKPIPFKDESDGKGTTKRTYWPRGDAMEKRREMRKQLEVDLAAKGKKWAITDKQKALDEKWGRYCEKPRSLEEINRSIRDGGS
jgi:hypothetical protein